MTAEVKSEKTLVPLSQSQNRWVFDPGTLRVLLTELGCFEKDSSGYVGMETLSGTDPKDGIFSFGKN